MQDIIGIGNPLLDSTVNVDHAFLAAHGLAHGGMTLIDAAKHDELLAALQGKAISNHPGGSVANTLAAASAIGGKTLFLGSIGQDANGETYERLIKELGIGSGLETSTTPQGQCLVMVTSEGERTMATFLGAALDLHSDEISETLIKEAKVLHIEGYQLDGEENSKAVFKACQFAKEYSLEISIDLADPGVIDRHEERLRTLINEYATIVFANETEAKRYTGLEEEAAAEQLAASCVLAVVKLGERGSIIAGEEGTFLIEGFNVPVVNTNGAGDTYAGIFLQSRLNGESIPRAGLLASYGAAQVVAQAGAQLTRDIRQDSIL